MKWIQITAAVWIAILIGIVLGYYNSSVKQLVQYIEDDLQVMNRASIERNKALSYQQWTPVQPELPLGVTVFLKNEVSPGYTLYMNSTLNAKLININGDIAHEWSIEGRLDRLSHEFTDPDLVYFRSAHLLQDGRLIVQMAQLNRTPWGASTIMLDKDSTIIWEHDAYSHHNVTVDKTKGLVYVLTHKQTEDWRPPAGFPSKKKVLIDSLDILDMEGNLLESISITDALRLSEYWWMFKHTSNNWDFLHNNDIELVTDAFRKKIPVVPDNSVLLSFRSMDAVAALDIDTHKIVWLISGPWKFHHDPDILPNGNLLIYDNKGLGEKQQSRVIEVEPIRGEIVWEYRGTRTQPFFSEVRGSQQLLENGNILITEPEQGRILEINRSGNLVWQFVNPEIHPKWPDQHRKLTHAVRYNFPTISFLETESH